MMIMFGQPGHGEDVASAQLVTNENHSEYGKFRVTLLRGPILYMTAKEFDENIYII